MTRFFIQVMGVTGAGKTTFAKYLAKRLKASLLEELPIDQNPFFVNYYRNPTKYSCCAQLFFLFSKWQQTKQVKRVKGVVQEPPIYEDALYAQARFKKNSWNWKSYQNFYQGLISAKDFSQPDLAVFLHLSFPKMLARIKKRAAEEPKRKVELQEKETYWQRLWQLHEDWIRKNPQGLKIVILDMDKFDFSHYNSIQEHSVVSDGDELNADMSSSFGGCHKNKGQTLEAAFQELKNLSKGLIK